MARTEFRLLRRKHLNSSPSAQKGKWRLRPLPYVVALLLLLAVRFFLLSHIQLPTCKHALVSLTYYGLRLPGERLWGYHRWGYYLPERGDSLVFTSHNAQGGELTLVGRCDALPGETIWIDPVRQKVIPGRTSPDAQPILLPGRNRSVRVTPYNARLLVYLMQHFEQCQNVRINAQGQLELDGLPMTQVQLLDNYYWVEMRPDSFVIVPHRDLIGKMLTADND